MFAFNYWFELKNILGSFDNFQRLKEIENLVMLADEKLTQDELNKISFSLINVFKEDPKKVEESLNKAFENKNNARSLYFYTSKLNKLFTEKKKIMLIEVLWEVILSDNEIHDFETSLIRRLAGLLYISDVECGNAKQRARDKIHLV